MKRIFDKIYLVSLAVILTISLAFSQPTALAAEYAFTLIDVPGSTLTIPYGINNLGQIVGFYNDPNAPGTNGRGFLLSGGTFTAFDMPGIHYPEGTIAHGINDRGQIVGEYGYGGGQRGFLLSGNTFTTIDVPGADHSGGSGTKANGINNLAQIVGEYHTNNYYGFLLSGGIYSNIEVPGALYSMAYGINDSGEIVGEFISSDWYHHGFLFSNGVFTTIDVPGARYPDGTVATGINNLGQIVGLFTDNNGFSRHGFLLSGDTFTTIDVPGYYNAFAVGINDRGQIVMHNYYQGFLATPVPEFIPVNIDIKPGNDPNSINPKSKGKIPVVILSTKDFNAPSQVDRDSLTFGSTGDESSLAFCNPKGEDINGDRLKDLVCHFYTQDTGFQCGDTEGVLKGKTKDGTPIQGSDSVRIVPCK